MSSLQAAVDRLSDDDAFQQTLERFALAEDRASFLLDLPEGSWEQSFFSLLHSQNQGSDASAFAVAKAATQRLIQDRDSSRASAGQAALHALQLRGALLSPDPLEVPSVASALRSVAGVQTSHQPPAGQALRPESGAGGPPSRLDPVDISAESILSKHLPALSSASGWSALKPAAVPLVAPLLALDESCKDTLAEMLSRLSAPDVENLVAAIVYDMNISNCGFTSRGVHRCLTLQQLQELQVARPSLLGEASFVQALVGAMAPTTAQDLASDDQARVAYFSRLLDFLRPLGQRFADSRLRVLGALLLERIKSGGESLSDPLFLELLEHKVRHSFTDLWGLPGSAGVPANRCYTELRSGLNLFGVPAFSAAEHQRIIRRYLLVAAPTATAPEVDRVRALLVPDIFNQLYAAAMIETGSPQGERLAATLASDPVRALDRHVLLEWEPTNAEYFAVDSAVELSITLRNVPEVLVRVFELDTTALLTSTLAQPDVSIALEGLVPTWEKAVPVERPEVRLTRPVPLPELPQRGIFVIDVIGAGGNVRALIRKGGLRFVERCSVAGHVITPLDEGCRPLPPGAVSLSLQGQRYDSNEDGLIVVPYSTAGGSVKTGVLTLQQPRPDDSSWGFSSLMSFTHRAEEYHLGAAVHVSREALRSGNEAARLAIRSSVTVCGTPAPLQVLENVNVAIITTDADNVPAREERRDVTLQEAQEWTTTFRVGERVRQLDVELSAKVLCVSTGKHVDLSASHSVPINAADDSAAIVSPHLRYHAVEGWTLLTLGRCGEPVPRTVVDVALSHRLFTTPISRQLQSDANGVAVLGRLLDIQSILVRLGSAAPRQFELPSDSVSLPHALVARTGGEVVLPIVRHQLHLASYCDGCRAHPLPGPRHRCQQCADYDLCSGCLAAGTRCDPTHTLLAVEAPLATAEMSFLQFTTEGRTLANHFDKLSYQGGYLRISGLETGEYVLHLKHEDHSIQITVAEALPEAQGIVADSASLYRLSEQYTRPGLQIASVETAPDASCARIQLAGSSSRARVHLVATQLCHNDSADSLRLPSVSTVGESLGSLQRPQSQFTLRRRLGDESRYVVDRQRMAPLPGVHLKDPSLLLRRWAIGTAAMETQTAQEGDSFSDVPNSAIVSASRMKKKKASAGRRRRAEQSAASPFATSVDWLQESSVLAYNLSPDADGVVMVPLQNVGDCSTMQIIATDDSDTLISRTLFLPVPMGTAAIPAARSLALPAPLAPDTHYCRLDRVLVAEAGQELLLPAEGTRYATTHTLRHAFQLFASLSTGSGLAEELEKWAFLGEWHKLSREEKCKKISSHGCHELHLFTKVHDAELFASVVRPYVQAKLQKQFIDLWLLDEDLSAFSTLEGLQKLNAAEKALLVGRCSTQDQDAVLAQALAQQVPEGRAFTRQAFYTALSPTEDAPEEEPPMPSAPMVGGFGAAPSASMGFGGGGGGGGGGFGNSAATFGSAGFGARARSQCAFDEDDDDEDDECEEDCKFDNMEERGGPGGPSDMRLRASNAAPRLFQAPATTQELVEAQYYDQHQPHPSLIQPSQFWADLAQHRLQRSGGHFVSGGVLGVTRSLNEVLMAMAVLELPADDSDGPPRGITVDAVSAEGQLRLTPSHSLVLYVQELVVDSVPELSGSAILVGQKMFEVDVSGNKRYLSGSDLGDLIPHQRYGCEVITTNVTPDRVDISILSQVPAGAVPLQKQLATDVTEQALQGFATQAKELHFYFPCLGSFVQYPAHVARGEHVVAAAARTDVTVVREHCVLDSTSWAQLAERGTTEDVLAFLSRNGPHRVDLDLIAWRMADKSAFEQITELLAWNAAFTPTLWGYAFVHGNLRRLRELLVACPRVVALAGPALDSSHLKLSAEEMVEHREYAPYVNARAHQLGDERSTPNPKAMATFRRLLLGAACTAGPSAAQLLPIVHHQALHGRIAEALALFQRICSLNAPALPPAVPAGVACVPAFHYMAGYLDLFNLAGGHAIARSVAELYRAYPVPHWRALFNDLEALLAEAETGEPDAGDPAVDPQAAANEDPDLSVSVVDGVVRLDVHALSAPLRVALHRIDVEHFFSTSPFMAGGAAGGGCRTVRASLVLQPQVAPGQRHVEVALPEALRNANVLVEASAGPQLRASCTHLCNTMVVTLAANHGVVRVSRRDTGRAIPAAYVKVYAEKTNGSVTFYKDGYTDLAGKYPYASLSTDELPQVRRFSILVVSPEFGAVVREAAPPLR